jgi:peptidyl-dipeptidase Dcp
MTQEPNPLLEPWTAPYGLPPFDRIRPAHFPAAFDKAMAAHRAELDAIAQSNEPPGFDNTIAAIDRAGRLLDRVQSVFWNLTASETSAELQQVEQQMAPVLAAHGNAIYLNAALFARIDALHAQRHTLALRAEQLRLLERIHLDFVRAGAKLTPEAKQRYAQITERLATLTTQFNQNVLADEAGFTLVLGEGDLAGLPDSLRAAAKSAAQERGKPDAWVITLSRSLVEPFITFSDRRDLREQAWRAWTSRGQLDPARDNLKIAQEIMRLRQEQAALHGYATYADYQLADTMAGSQHNVQALLQQVWEPAKAKAREERDTLAAYARAHGHAGDIAPWDWRYYAEKVRAEQYDLDNAAIKPYFALEAMQAAVFDVAGRLFGLRFEEKHGVPLYHPDVRLFEVRRKLDGGGEQLVGIFLADNFARASKRGGAWMSSYRQQSRNASADGRPVLPIVVNNNNFAKAPAGEPTLLSLDDVRTLFHEFGHGLHGLLSNVTYERLSGTNVLRDFVELPSQIYENWALEPEVLRRHARHVRTGEAMPDALIERIHRARRFNQGFETIEYTASALVDMALHARADAGTLDLAAFEREELQRIGMPREIVMRHRLPHFLHLFAGDAYAAGYYVYMWAEVLDADGFDAFKEAGDLFDKPTAEKLYRHIYSAGNSVAPQDTYRAFRGRDPKVEPMLRARGLLNG